MIGERVRRARMGKGLDQTRAAEAGGITKAALSRIENGHSKPGIDTLQRLAKAWGVTLAELVDPANAKRSEDR